MMHQRTPEFVWYIAKEINGERWYLVRVEDGGRYWSKQATKGRYWYGLPATKAFVEEHFAIDEVVIGGKARMI